MAPPGGRFGPQGLSTPFGHMNHGGMAQNSHLHHNAGLASQQQQQQQAQQQRQQQQQQAQQQQHQSQQQQLLGAAGGHHGFGGGVGMGPNIFTPGAGVAGLQSAFGNGAGGIGGGGLAGMGGLGGIGGGMGGNGGGRGGLESEAARLGFAHGAALQQQQQGGQHGHGQDGSVFGGPGAGQGKGMAGRIREVWRTNLVQEMANLRAMVEQYPYISMDTEFPGVVARPMGDFPTKASYHYQTVRCNVDLLKTIQIGVTLFNSEGEVPPPDLEVVGTSGQRNGFNTHLSMFPCSWTFNFKFSVDEDMSNEESIAVLKKAGCDFDKHAELGIDPRDFGSLLITSGLALSPDAHWISFHGGYDFAYLVKLMWAKELPPDEEEFRKLISVFFPNLYDVKFLLRHAQKLLNVPHTYRSMAGTATISTISGDNRSNNGGSSTPGGNQSTANPTSVGLTPQAMTILTNLGQRSGLQDLAEELACQRHGTQHTAGSDAWLTGSVFFQLLKKIFDGRLPTELNGQMWGLTGVGAPASAAARDALLAAQGHTLFTGLQAHSHLSQQQQGMAGAAGGSGHGQQQHGGILHGLNGGGFHGHGHREGGPSTPTSNAVAMAVAAAAAGGSGAGTPAGRMGGGMGGGAFGNFSYGN